MLAADEFMRTQQVARALGVSVSTIKRWVDSGVIQATRTIGKHRLISRQEMERFAKELGVKADFGSVDVRLEGEGTSRVEIPSLELRPSRKAIKQEGYELVDELVSALRRGRSSEVRDLVIGTYLRWGPVTLADSLIQPAMQRLGHDWEVNGIDVFQEHRATRLVKLALFELVQSAMEDTERRENAPLAMGSSPEGDPYTLPGLLCELTLRWLGWDVINLGVNLPLSSLAKAVRAHRPRMVWISVSFLTDQAKFIDEYAGFFQAATACDAAVVLGGQALSAELRTKLVATSFGDRMAHLAEFARLLSRPVINPGRNHNAD